MKTHNSVMDSEPTELTSISLEKGIRDRLKTYGVKGETYNDIMIRLMDEHDKRADE